MKTILVTTDFSEHAHWATDYALELASQLNARLVVIHVYDPLPNTAPAHEWLTSSAEAEYYLAIRKLGQLQRQMLKTTKGSVDVLIMARPVAALFSSPTTVIMEETVNQKVDLLVMGLANDEPLKAGEWGSMATDLIPVAPVPMLLIPAGATFHHLKDRVSAAV